MFPAETFIKIVPLGLPLWLSGNESACQCRRHQFDPWFRKIPHAKEQKIPYTTTTDPEL